MSGSGTTRVLEHLHWTDLCLWGPRGVLPVFDEREREGVSGEPGREGRRPLASFCGKEAGGHGQKREKRMFGARETHAKTQRHAEHCKPRNHSCELPEDTAPSPAARLRCLGKGLSWQLWKDPKKK